jgi:hypothetical protein
MLHRLLVHSAIELLIVVQIVRGWEVVLFVTRAVDEEEARERIDVETFLSLQEIDARRPEISHRQRDALHERGCR